tara:strand:+ start:361 stop:543 length:183 start_codon:yes stop_codon:yes gene_type:complete
MQQKIEFYEKGKMSMGYAHIAPKIVKEAIEKNYEEGWYVHSLTSSHGGGRVVFVVYRKDD